MSMKFTLFSEVSVIQESICNKLSEPRREKTGFFAYAKTKTQISFAVTAKLISAFVFAIRIVHFLFYLNTKFQASSHLLSLCSLICVDLIGNPEDRFSHNEAHLKSTYQVY